MSKETLKDYSGRILGYVETNSNGDKTISDFTGRILGTYSPSTNMTKDFTGRIIGYGDLLARLLP